MPWGHGWICRTALLDRTRSPWVTTWNGMECFLQSHMSQKPWEYKVNVKEMDLHRLSDTLRTCLTPPLPPSPETRITTTTKSWHTKPRKCSSCGSQWDWIYTWKLNTRKEQEKQLERKKWKQVEEERMKRGGQTDKRNMYRGRMDRRWNKCRWMKIQYHSDAAIPTASAPLSPPSEKVINQPMELRGVEIA